MKKTMGKAPILVSLFAILFLTVLTAASHAASLPEGIYAEMETSKGKILFRLYYKEAPMTAANFMGLAEGVMPFKDPFTGETRKAPFYDHAFFHKLLPGMMVQGGDPKGDGHGGPGYCFEHEFRPYLKHDRAGILSMLNKGPYSHGSQFFITLGPAPYFDGKHTVFGEAFEGMENILKLEPGDRILKVSIERYGKEAEAFDLEEELSRVQLSTKHAALEMERRAREEAKKEALKNRKEIPAPTGEIDPAKLPGNDQPLNEKIAVQYILVSYKGARFSRPQVRAPFYDKEGAGKAAQKLARLARTKGADFLKLAKTFSDDHQYEIPLMVRGKGIPPAFDSIFRLKEGQVNDPVDAPEGFVVLKRVKLDLRTVRHILISYQGAEGTVRDRSKAEAKELAETLRRRARAGEDFAALARSYSDRASAKKGGLIKDIAKGMTLPAFDQAVFRLGIGEVSAVISTPAGFQIIKRER